jgi:hypothetical protein
MLKNIGTISDKWLQHLIDFATNLPNDAYMPHPYFPMTDAIDCTLEYSRDNPVMYDFLRDEEHGLAQILDIQYLRAFTFDRMRPMSYLNEHSDLRPGQMIAKNVASTIHKVHIPLITNRYVAFAWVPEKVVVHNITPGNIYLFNNVVKHNAMNLSDEYRYHMILRYEEPAYTENINDKSP